MNFRAAHNQPSKRLGKQSGACQSSSQITTNDTFRTVSMTSVNGDLPPPQNHLDFAVDFHAELTPDFRQSSSETTSDLFLVV